MNNRTNARLRRLFQTIVSVTFASSAGACSQAISPADFTSNVCNANSSYDELSGVTPGTPTDSIAIIAVDGASTFPVSSQGTACATATDMPACMQAVGSTQPSDGWSNSFPSDMVRSRHYAVITRGDVVSTATSIAELAALIAPIDTPQDAALLVSESGFRLDCSGNNVRTTTTGFEVLAESGFACGAGTGVDQHLIAVNHDGTLTVLRTVRIQDGAPNCAVGRRPEGMRVSANQDQSLGGYFAEIAALEAASVSAFERLARELEAHRAPNGLVRAAKRSARDEVRHAKLTSQLASRFGATSPEVEVAALPVRDRFAIALENATEGCIRETFGALQATHQARHASDPAIATIMRGIAVDETRHAALAWDVATWLEPQLTHDERAAVEAARVRAGEDLFRELGCQPHHDAVALAGAPTAAQARELYRAFAMSLRTAVAA